MAWLLLILGKLLLNNIQTPALILAEHYILMTCIFIESKKMAHKKNKNEFYDF